MPLWALRSHANLSVIPMSAEEIDRLKLLELVNDKRLTSGVFAALLYHFTQLDLIRPV